MRWRPYKRFILIIVGVWLFFVIFGLILSRTMQGKVIEILSNKANKHLLCEIHLQKKDIHFSVFKRFPHASLELRNVAVMLPEGFNTQQSILIKGDTLLFAEKVYLQLNLKSVLTQKYQLEKIEVHKGYLQILSDKQGKSSLDILVPIAGKTNNEVITQIDQFSCTALNIYTSDIANKSQTHTYIRKGNLSGTFETQKFSVNIKADGTIKRFEGKEQVLDLHHNFAVDAKLIKDQESYIVEKGFFSFGNIPFKVIGSIRTGENNLVDLIFSAKKVSVKQIDNTLLKGLLGENGFQPKGGVLNVQATFIGYTKHSLPAIKAKFKLTEGKLYDKLHDITLTDVYFAGNGDNGQDHFPKSTTIRLDTFSFKTKQSHQWGKLKIFNLVEPRVSLALNGRLDIADLKAVVNFPNLAINHGSIINKTVLSGQINKDSEAGKSVITKLKIKGNFALEDLEIELTKYSFPSVLLNGKVELANNNTLRFNELKAKCANSDVSISGLLKNFNVKNGIPDFQGIVHAGNLRVDDFIEPVDKRTGKSNPIIFPDSLRISGKLLIDQFSFGNFQSSNYSSNVLYSNKRLNASSVNMDGFEGHLQGLMTLHQNSPGNIALFVDAHVNHVNMHQLFKGCNNFSQDVILAEHIGGYLSGPIEFNAEWSNTLDFNPKSVVALGQLKIVDGILANYSPLMGLSSFINIDELKKVTFDELNTSISIRNSQVYLAQTHIASSAITFNGSGTHDFDNKYEYRLQLGLSDVLWKKAKNKDKSISEFGYVTDDGVGHTMLPLIVSGKGTTFDVKYDKRKARETFRKKVQDEKKELKDLFRKKNDEVDEIQQEQEFLIDNDNNKKEEKPVLEKTDTDTYESSSDDFILQWDDSEEEE